MTFSDISCADVQAVDQLLSTLTADRQTTVNGEV